MLGAVAGIWASRNAVAPSGPTINFSYISGTMPNVGASRQRVGYSPAIGFGAAAGGLFNQRLYISLSGTTWAADTGGVTYGGGTSVAGSPSVLLLTSSDSLARVVRYTSSGSSSLISTGMAGITNHATYTGSSFVVLSGYNPGLGVEDHRLAESPSGLAGTWTVRTLPPAMPTSKSSLTYGGGKGVIFTYSPSTAWYSTDLATWQQSTLPVVADTTSWGDCAYGNGTFVAVPLQVSVRSPIHTLRSTDGVTWTEGGQLVNDQATSLGSLRISFGGGLFCALCARTLDNLLYFSVDGTAWAGPFTLPDSPAVDLAYGNGTFVTIPSSLASPNNKTYVITATLL